MPYLVMAFVEGQSLADRLRTGPVTPAEAARLSRDVALAMHYAHERGVIHRDLKPGNILLDAQGNPKVADFGLAKLRSSDHFHTVAGDVLGTPGYLAPEQVTDSPNVTPRADVYALGAILYCLLTGRPPFQAATRIETIRQAVQQEPIPPRRLNAQVPLDLDTLCLKCLEKEPTQRFSTAAEFAAELDRYLRGEPIRSRPVGPIIKLAKWCVRNPVVASLTTAIAIVLLFSSVVSTYFGLRASAQTVRANLRTEDAKRAEQEARKQTAKLAFTNGLAKHKLHQLREAETNLLQAWTSLPADDPLEFPYRQVLWDRLTQRSLPLTAVPIRHKTMCFSAEFSPDGNWIVTTGDREARLWDAETGHPVGKPMRHKTPEQIAIEASQEHERQAKAGNIRTDAANAFQAWSEHLNTFGGPRVLFSPDGSRLLCRSNDTQDLSTDLRFFNIPSTDPSGPIGPKSTITSWAFSPRDRRLLVTRIESNQMLLSIFDLDRRSFADLQSPLDRSVSEIKFSPTGEHFVTQSKIYNSPPPQVPDKHRGWEFHVQLWETPNRKIGAIIPNARLMAFSTDGTQLATFGAGTQGFVWNCADGVLIRELRHSAKDSQIVAISPDFAQVITQDLAERSDRFQVWNSIGGQELATLKHDDRVTCLQFSPDGKLLITGGHDKTARIWDTKTWAIVGEPLRHDPPSVTMGGFPGQVDAITFSPDGSKFLTKTYGTVHVWRTPTIAPTVVNIPQLDRKVRFAFAADNSCVVVATKNQEIQVWDLVSGNQVGKSIRLTEPVSHLYLSPDKSVVVAAFAQGKVRLAYVATGEFGQPVFQYPPPIRQVVLNPHHSRLVIQSDQGAQLFDTDTGNTVGQPILNMTGISKITFTPDGSRFITGSHWHGAQIWNAETGEAVTPVLTSLGPVQSVGMSSDGKLAFWAGMDSYVRLCDASTGELLKPEMVQGSAIIQATFSPSGNQIASVGLDKTLCIWDTNTRTLRFPPVKLDGVGRRTAFSPDGFRVVVDCSPSRSRMFDSATGAELGISPSPQPSIEGFSSDGKSLIGTLSGMPCRWNAPTPPPDRGEALRIFSRWTQLTADEKGRVRELTHEEWLKLWDE